MKNLNYKISTIHNIIHLATNPMVKNNQSQERYDLVKVQEPLFLHVPEIDCLIRVRLYMFSATNGIKWLRVSGV